ncbi:hypothetical protein H671_3g10525 [Cricetulus griseus]|nr:hypothetical protein H671_3g10525 [Cricetulus griseus]
MQGTQNELVTYNLNSFPRKPVTYKEEEHTHCHLMSFHTVAEHIPYARHWPSCVGNQSWVKHVPWSPGEAHDLVEESDMYINNYNVCQNEDGVSIPPGPTAV